ncbi:unnamed protein product [Musa acuminata subsp. malaccensis]|uniref:histidine kinase n=1 Tax=Musa acuminata subsp. malaccensis TaxID=214687 RepID=A0A804L8K7_MUSAM|nr:unnamed protein product [Musa acuminata subsp. malaccensis]
MEWCDCIEPQWHADELLVKYQYTSDFLIAFAYFSIPLELIYFVKKSSFFPYRWLLIQFGAFIVLCGSTHMISLRTFTMYSRTVALLMTVAKISTAVVSCATALMLVHIIPELLSVKTRELFLKNKAEELDREIGVLRAQEETERHVRMLTHEIRSTLDRHTILKTTFIELGRTLDLEECAFWMPSRNGINLQLSHTLHHQMPLGSVVCTDLPVINQVLSNDVNYWPELSLKSYAIMVLMSARKWHVHEMELVEAVADQVAVALSHAAILEESMRACDLLLEQNVALDSACQEAETAINARNDFQTVMTHEMWTSIHATIALSSLLLETELTPEQQSMLEIAAFKLHTIFREVTNLMKPIAAVKNLSSL